jgi:hypothetical protein
VLNWWTGMMAVPFAARQTAGLSDLDSRVPRPSGVGNEFHYVAMRANDQPSILLPGRRKSRYQSEWLRVGHCPMLAWPGWSPRQREAEADKKVLCQSQKFGAHRFAVARHVLILIHIHIHTHTQNEKCVLINWINAKHKPGSASIILSLSIFLYLLL